MIGGPGPGGVGLAVGDEVRLSYGPETFSPIKYNTFTVGPITASTRVLPGETGDAAFLRLSKTLHAMYEAQFATCSEQFLERIREVNTLVEARKG